MESVEVEVLGGLVDSEFDAVFVFPGVRTGAVGEFDVEEIGFGEGLDLHGFSLLSGKSL